MDCNNLIFLYTLNTTPSLRKHCRAFTESLRITLVISQEGLKYHKPFVKPTLAPKMRFSKQIAVTVALTIPFAFAYSLADLPSCAVSLLNPYPK